MGPIAKFSSDPFTGKICGHADSSGVEAVGKLLAGYELLVLLVSLTCGYSRF